MLADTGGSGFSPDTTVFTGSGQSIPIYDPPFYFKYAYKSIRVAQSSGTATFASSLTLPNDLVVSSGTLSLNSHAIGVTGNFRTEGTGVLGMTSASDSLGVGSNATFSGGSTTGTLTAGVISVVGNFAQSGTATSFAPATAHRVRLQPAGTTKGTVSFTSPTTSFFDSLVVEGGFGSRDTVQLLTDMTVNRGMTIQNSADIIGSTARARITGGTLHAVLSTTSPTMKALATELSVTPAIGSSPVLVSPDTMIYNGSITSLPTGSGIVYKSVRVNTTGSLTSPGGVTYNGNLIVSAGTYTAGGSSTDSVGGFLRTEGTGAFSMPVGAGAPTVAVRDSVVFGGGASTGLTTGTLRIYGSFVQRNTATAFQATSGHTTVFAGSGTQAVTFANPGASGASTFGNLALERSVAAVSQTTGIQLGNNVFVAGLLEDSTTNSAVLDTIAGNGFTVTAGGISTGSQFVIDNALLVLNNFTTFNTSGLTFRNMNPAATYLTMNRNTGGSNTIIGLNFATAVTSGVGKYFSLSTGTVTYSLTATSSLPAAPSMTGNYVRTGSPLPTVSWNGTVNP